MAYRVWIGGTAIDCETPEAALELARHIEGDSSAQPTTRTQANGSASSGGAVGSSSSGGSRWTERRVADFFRLIDGHQRRVVDILLEHGDGRTDNQLMTALGFSDGRALGGVFGGLWKNAKKVGADPDDLYEKKAASIGGKKAYEYFLKDSFRRTAQAHKAEK
jgi:hypothetical protein